ncbi:MAM and LDL-receptor class A domain-containing protein 1 isoform X3 [Silurus meridionalis]|uniref:MAM and LDL-receptor class A domain-containing protein 1 isoform X3 n=1 Tax=Silurus meridionalis TaxID=175797 RepID=UPI001EEC6B5D|nr:MAM and LDL-receptor class A domain-containing protein 1 isoform X3 [Silurus meridionalis]
MAGHMWLCLLLKSCIIMMITEASLSKPSVNLPDWQPNADFMTKCDFDSDQSPFCDWSSQGLIRSQAGHEKFYLSRDPMSPVGWLKSKDLYFSGDSCLEFWYYKPGHDSSELRVLLSDDGLKTQIWSSVNNEGHTWRQVLIPLSYSEIRVKIILELTHIQGMEETVFDRVAVHQGQCDSQCQPGTQFWTDESTQCTCIESQLACAKIACGDGHPCNKAALSKRSSNSNTYGTCKVTSDLRFTTFDGVISRFMGHCFHVLTKVCNESSLLPDFVVEVKNEQIGQSPKFKIQQVNLRMQSVRVTLQRRNKRKIMVNGIWKSLPMSLDNDTIKVSSHGPTVVLQTNFNLSISFAKSGALQLTVPMQYSDKLCGMCGNFNNIMDDDKNMPGSSLVKDTHILGQKWKSANPLCQEPIVPNFCSESEELHYASEVYCGVLLSQNGPFSECSSSLDNSNFYRSCISEMCTTYDPEAFCDIFQAIEKSCSEVGISVTGWRNATNCSLACGPNSHFNACSRDCPATCSDLDAAEDCGSCQERCDCDYGFLLSGGRCVPAEDCGCWIDGQHYKRGETFMEGDCERLCTCASNGNIQCSPTSCLANEVCKVKSGVLGCFPSNPVTCSVYGDPHYITFDGKAYSFQGTCNYTVAKTCSGDAVRFTLTARNEDIKNTKSASLNTVALNLDGFHLTIKKNKLVYVNGGQITLPFSHNTSVHVSQKGPYVLVETKFGLRFLFNGNDRLFVQLDERHKGSMCGLCGTYSGSQFDDFLTPDGNVVPYSHDFANSWNTYDKEWPCVNGSQDKPKCSPELENKGIQECSKLYEDVFKDCHWFVPPQIYVNSCVEDYCYSQGHQFQLCNSLENYVAACEVSEVFLGAWWKGTVCEVQTTPPTEDTSTPTPSQPTTPICSASCSWSCNFDQDECGWEQLIQDSFEWTRWSGSTPSDFTGPSSDHTTGSGFYMYTEGDGVYHGDSARMISPACNTLGTQCMTFWYHMYGWAASMMLNVYLLEQNRAIKIWSKSNSQGNHWHEAQIEISPMGPFQIIVEGIRGSNNKSDVAWDDVTIVHGKCGAVSMMPELEEPSPTNGGSSNTVCEINCNFDSNLCTWTQMLTDAFDWTRHSGPTPTSKTGPLSDHTTGSGYYLYIEGDSALHGDTARLLSEECTHVQPQCLQFWYHMYGSSWTMGLSVYLLHGNVAQEVWSKREDQGNAWHQAQVNITPHGKFKILFEGRRGDNAWSDVAFDDVSIHRGPCTDLINHQTLSPTPKKPTLIPAVTSPTTKSAFSPVCTFNCNFDNNLCTWSQIATDVFDWTRHSGPTSTAFTGPSFDHTTGTGYYLYIEGDSALHGDTARLLSDECSDIQPQCLQFWYHMYGSSWTMGLSVYLLHGNVAQEVWRKREDQGNAWHQAQVNITPHDKFKILFEGRRGHNDRSDVALDDVTLLRGPCAGLLKDPLGSPVPEMPTIISPVSETTTHLQSHTRTSVVAPVHRNGPVLVRSNSSPVCGMNCNFDYNLCTWTQLLTDVFDWTRQQGSTPTLMTGPSSDHTTGAGYYLYIEGDSALHGDTARLLSDECSDIQPQCLQFWYHMYGSSWTMGLSVYLLHGNVAQEVWRKREDQGNAWHQAQVNITPHDKFKILFEGRRGHNDRSDVALDDVTLLRGPCAGLLKDPLGSPVPEMPTIISPVSETTTPLQSHTRTSVVAPVHRNGPVLVRSNSSPVCGMNCNFDYNLCTWTQLLTDVFDWTRQQGSTPTLMTGPSSDHTTGAGYYLYIEGDSALHGDTARLLSDECSDIQPQCLQFWYHMYGSSWTMGLSVYLLHGNVAQEVWRKREDQGNAWHQAQVNITPHDKFKILFEGRRGHNDRSDVALDDVTLLRGPCAGLLKDPHGSPVPEMPTIISPVSETTTPLKSHTRTSVVAPVHRNGPVLVRSNSSPVCGMNCNFDYNLCTWTQLLTDVFDWTRQQGSTPTLMTGPSSDHTTGAGYYLYIEGDSALHGDTARLLSDECSDIQPQCLQFWYHMYGSSWTMGLSVYLLHGNVAQEVWRKREDQGNAWHQAQVNITPHGKFKILFEGRRGHNDRSDVALDDVTLLRGPCAGLLKDPLGSPVPEMPTIIFPVSETTTPLQSHTRTSVVAPVHRNGPVLVRSNSSPVCGMNCNFDYNLCTWTQLLTDVFDWTRQQGSTPTLMTGPSSDHTTGAGYYLYIEGDSAVHGDTARLLSEECTNVQPQCLQFWYHMYGSSWTMGLSVYLLHGNVAQEVWRKREDQGNIWHQALVDITPHGKFKILFEGRRGHNARSDVALDDVFIHRGTCADLRKHLVGSPAPATTGQ